MLKRQLVKRQHLAPAALPVVAFVLALFVVLAARPTSFLFWLVIVAVVASGAALFLGGLVWLVVAATSRKPIRWPVGTLLAAPAIGVALVVCNWTFDLQTVGNERRGTVIADALERYHADTGQYPSTLDALCPKYLPRLPVCWYGLWPSDFWYRNEFGMTFVKFNDVPAISGRFYHLRSGNTTGSKKWESSVL
jgi:hypothetical protein